MYSYLKDYAGLAALVGDRIYPVTAPQNVALPYCVYMRVSNVREYSHAGYSTLHRARMQVTCFAESYAQVKQTAAKVIAALEAWPGADENVLAALHQGERDVYDPSTGIYYVPVDFFVWHAGEAG